MKEDPSIKVNHILLIDDSEDDIFFHKRALAAADATLCVHVCLNGEEALAFLSQQGSGHVPDIIYLDINMPRLNGWEFLERYEALEKSENKQKTHIIVLSTSSSPSDLRKSREHTLVSGFLKKPLTKEKVLQAIKDYQAAGAQCE